MERSLVAALLLAAFQPGAGNALPVTPLVPTQAAAEGPAPVIRVQSPSRAAVTGRPVEVTAAGFRAWLSEFRARAARAGISAEVLDTAFTGVTLDLQVIERDRNQNEFSRTLWDYLDSAVSANRIRSGREAMIRDAATLRAVEARYGVEAEILAAIWGLESAYGAVRGHENTIAALASLAYEGRRRDFFEAELMAALMILERGETHAGHLRGSWAGAMGHMQFMPSSFLAHAVDMTGDGRRDIWGESAADALASAANYLAANGWTTGQPWGMEVILPEGFDFRQSGERIKRGADHWNALGVRLANGEPVPDYGPSSILLPAGHTGVALVIYQNFHVLESYNTADAYVIAVGHLADRIGGGPAFRGGWPRQDRALSYDERVELQERLTAAGFDTLGIDGIVGPNTIEAVRRFQASEGLVPDGYAPPPLLDRLR